MLCKGILTVTDLGKNLTGHHGVQNLFEHTTSLTQLFITYNYKYYVLFNLKYLNFI